jgi:hypothetical protein
MIHVVIKQKKGKRATEHKQNKIGEYNYRVSGYCPLSCFYLKHVTFLGLDSVPVFRWSLLSRAQWIELVTISGQQNQHKRGCINEAQN